MSYLFLRQAEVIVGDSSEALLITGLRVYFQIKKSRLAEPNKGEVHIYNLAESTRAKIENEFTKIIINAGYKGQVAQVFFGDIRNVFHQIEDENAITKIYIEDGGNGWQNGIVNQTIGSGVSLKDTVIRLAQTFTNVSIGTLNGLDQGKVNNDDIAFSGATKDVLNHLASTYNFNWSIQDNIFETVANNGATTTQDQAFIVSSQTGMIGSPSLTEIGINVKTLFNNRLLPNRYINVKAASFDASDDNTAYNNSKKTNYQGNYLINAVTHTFDTRGDEGSSFIECRRP